MLTMSDVAQRLNCSVTTVRRYIAAGELEAVKKGNLIRIDEAAFARFFAERFEPLGRIDPGAAR